MTAPASASSARGWSGGVRVATLEDDRLPPRTWVPILGTTEGIVLLRWLVVFGLLLVAVLVPLLVNRWGRNREQDIDDYFEHEYRDPPILGGGTWPSGSGF